MVLFAVRHWRKSSSGRWTVAAAVTVEIIVDVVNLKVEKVVVLSQNQRKIQARATVIHRVGSLSLLCCHCSSFLPPPFYSFVSSLQPPRLLLSPPVSSTCPLPTPPLFPVLFFFFFLPHITFVFLVSFISENSHPFMQSFHFSTPLHSFCL